MLADRTKRRTLQNPIYEAKKQIAAGTIEAVAQMPATLSKEPKFEAEQDEFWPPSKGGHYRRGHLEVQPRPRNGAFFRSH